MPEIDVLTVLALVFGLAAMGLAIRKQRRLPAAPISREQELLSRVATLERDIAGLQRMLVEKQNEIDRLNERLRQVERGATAMDQEPLRAKRVLLVGVGNDIMLQEDLAQLRRVQTQTDIRISRLLPVSKASLVRTLDRHRATGNPVRLLHLATHSSPQGLAFADGVATGQWLSEHLSGVEIAVLAGCSGDQVADLLGVVPAVVSMREDVDNKAASAFAGAFWLAVGLGLDANEAFERALQRAPALVSEFVELHL